MEDDDERWRVSGALGPVSAHRVTAGLGGSSRGFSARGGRVDLEGAPVKLLRQLLYVYPYFTAQEGGINVDVDIDV